MIFNVHSSASEACYCNYFCDMHLPTVTTRDRLPPSNPLSYWFPDFFPFLERWGEKRKGPPEVIPFGRNQKALTSYDCQERDKKSSHVRKQFLRMHFPSPSSSLSHVHTLLPELPRYEKKKSPVAPKCWSTVKLCHVFNIYTSLERNVRWTSLLFRIMLAQVIFEWLCFLQSCDDTP